MFIDQLPRTGQRFVTTWRFAKDPFGCYRAWKRRFGDNFLVNALNGDVVVSANLENIRRIFKASFDEVEPFAVETIHPLVGSRSIFLLQGEEHRRERALLSPPFHCKGMESQALLIREIAQRTADRWRPTDEVRIMDAALEVSLEVIFRVVFGIQTKGEIETCKRLTIDFVQSFHPILAFTKLFQRSLLGLSPWNRFIKNRKAFYEFLDCQIRKSRNHHSDSNSTILGHLTESVYENGEAVSNEDVRDQLVSLLLAGHETTQIAIAWGMSWLHRETGYLEELREQLGHDDSVMAIMKNELLHGICNESLRLNSVVSDTIRKLTRPMQWEEGELPEGTNIAIPICLIHEDESLYPEPFSFRPERWQERQFKPHEFIPFGGGVRRCIGAPLAMMEMKMVLATWVLQFEFELPTGYPVSESIYRRNITMAPRSGIPLIFKGQRI